MLKSHLSVAFILGAMLLLLSCGKGEKAPAPAPENIIAAHTSGIISCESSIRVRFVHDRVDTSEVNQPLADSPFEFDPDLEGITLWSSRNTLEFRPSERLPAGQTYMVKVQLSDIIDPIPQPEWFSFRITTMTQSFQVIVDGLQVVDTKDLAVQRLNGKIVTADAEYSSGVENLLTARQEERELALSWSHDENQRVHSFTVDSVLRGEDSSLVVLTWDGGPVDVDDKGTKEVVVPPVNTFAVSAVRPVQGKEQYIEVRFSDPVMPSQDLRGLITIDGIRRPRFTIDGNVVRVYNPDQWVGEVELSVTAGIRNSLGQRLRQAVSQTVTFAEVKPQVRFVGKGVIIPGTQGLTVPIEAVNLQAVMVQATPIREENVPQFLQVNALDGVREMKRVARPVWKDVVPLEKGAANRNHWVQYGLDVSPLLENYPAGLYRLTLTFRRPHILYDCDELSEEDAAMWRMRVDDELANPDWDNYSYRGGYGWRDLHNNRHNPCHPGYYQHYYDHRITVSRNVLVSNIGLMAKKGLEDTIFVAATDIGSAEPLGGVGLTVLDYQQNVVGTATTDGDGMAVVAVSYKPFLLVAEHGGQLGYLRLADGSALSVSHFDVSGERSRGGCKGFLYGDRGVWRPGDSLFLTFVLMDPEKRLPLNHPLRFELHDSRGQQVTSFTRKLTDSGFYAFRLATAPDAPTGNWTARVRLGGRTFEKKLKIETVMPNRLKVQLDFGEGVTSLAGRQLAGEVSSTWLHGAPARQLKTDVEVTFSSAPTLFEDFSDYQFSDPARRFRPESHKLFEGTLDEKGVKSFTGGVNLSKIAPGMLRGFFLTRVFEPGGAFSVDYSSIKYHPFDRYVGIKVPKGDRWSGALVTDSLHQVALAVVDTAGRPVDSARVEVRLYKIKWRWWWDRSAESPADYLGRSGYQPLEIDTVTVLQGRGDWEFSVEYPAWGRYLVRAFDLEGRHQTGKIVYIDWPGWAGRARKDTPGAANVLTFSSDKTMYTVGEPIVLTVPTGQAGRALVSIESSSSVVQADWIEASEEPTRYEFTATTDMVPNVYAHVTFVQPHLQAGNDLPIRMYGVIPLTVTDPATHLSPRIEAPKVFSPLDTVEISVREDEGRKMTYTLAVVDEGLLDLTRFQTPDPWSHFYKREALGVKTWDLFDMVAGAYGGKLEQLLAIGGGVDKFAEPEGAREAKRFEPMVRFLGPFVLERSETQTHRVDIPQYVGSVRLMVVAGQDGAFGRTEQTRPVRRPLMILGTLPRVLGTNETVDLPISVFALEPSVTDVELTVEVSGEAEVVGAEKKRLTFDAIGDQMITFKLQAGSMPGIATVVMRAIAGSETAEQRIEIDVRAPGFPITEVMSEVVKPGETWSPGLSYPGAPGTNSAALEVSRVAPMNLEKRLGYLIRYPHGCVEQTTSAVFPQLYLGSLLDLTPEQQDKIQENIKAAIHKYPRFQAADGGFGFWRGGHSHDWSTSYAGHFLIEASKAGYTLPAGMMARWVQYQRKVALSWVRDRYASELAQAYRLYTLALYGQPELGAMNRLKEELDLQTAARWRLAAAYHLAGQPEVAREMAKDLPLFVKSYRELSGTFGSTLRDRAMILETLCLIGLIERAEPVVLDISEELCSQRYWSTQSLAFALIAMARHAGITGPDDQWSFRYRWGNEAEEEVRGSAPMVQVPFDIGGEPKGEIAVTNDMKIPLYTRMILEGTPPAGRERAFSNGMTVSVAYSQPDGGIVDVSRLEQGTDIVAAVTVTNTGRTGSYYELALTQIVPSGWEIRNLRMEQVSAIKNDRFDYQDIRDDRVYTYFDLGQDKSATYRIMLNAAYTGRFYLPMVNVAAMYDETINARVAGQWVEVVRPGGGN